jgi:hypothetical protein
LCGRGIPRRPGLADDRLLCCPEDGEAPPYWPCVQAISDYTEPFLAAERRGGLFSGVRADGTAFRCGAAI